MPVDPKASEEWRRLVRAVDTGAGAEWAIEGRHLGRARRIVIEDCGAITFQVERHPALDGQTTVGRPSAAFKRVLATYRFDGSNGLVLVDEHVLGTEIDVEMAARETVEPVLEGDDLSFLDDLQTETDARVAGERYARSIDWLICFVEPLPEHNRAQLLARCQALAVELLVARWCEGNA
jgi:hypothetical protein